MDASSHGGARPGAGRKPHATPHVKRTVILAAEADAVVCAQRHTGESYSATLERLVVAAGTAHHLCAQTPLEHLLAQVTTTVQQVRMVYRGLGWTRQALERLVHAERSSLARVGVRLHVATKDAAMGRRERYITVDGVPYSALSRDS